MKLSSLCTPSHGTVRVLIGSRYTGRPAAHADTTTGTYWEALPKIEGGMLTIQRMLLAQPKHPVRLAASIVARFRRAPVDPRTGAMRGAA
jgi:hypothetical protein